jgi:hypothetical protein
MADCRAESFTPTETLVQALQPPHFNCHVHFTIFRPRSSIATLKIQREPITVFVLWPNVRRDCGGVIPKSLYRAVVDKGVQMMLCCHDTPFLCPAAFEPPSLATRERASANVSASVRKKLWRRRGWWWRGWWWRSRWDGRAGRTAREAQDFHGFEATTF